MKNGIHKTFVLTGTLAAAVLVLWVIGCGKSKGKPLVQNAAYRAETLLREDFDGDLHRWFVSGQGRVEIGPDSTLHLGLGESSDFLILWSTREVSGNFQLEYTVRFPDSCGGHAVLFCAQGEGGKDITRMSPPPVDAVDAYLKDSLSCYQVSCHNYGPDGEHISSSRVRKNPGNLLLSSAGFDPCEANRDYIIDVFKLDNRIQFYVDGVLIHDLRDRGGFGPTYQTGKIGFLIKGRPGAFSAEFNRIRLYKLKLK
ncbi:MAG TPA: DUF1961 family protein [bacterium]